MENRYNGLEAFAPAKIKTAAPETPKIIQTESIPAPPPVAPMPIVSPPVTPAPVVQAPVVQKESIPAPPPPAAPIVSVPAPPPPAAPIASVPPPVAPKVEEPSPEMLALIFEKSFDCPVCERQFKAYTTKTTVKLEGVDDDLMPTYSPVDPLLYDALVCPNCGYSALRANFSSITERQAELIQAEITPSFKHTPNPMIMNIDAAVADYKMALLNCIVKKGKLNEKGFICMKISWLYKRKGDTKNELAFVKQAYDSFTAAFSKESLPFCGLDENTVNYVLARFSMKLGLLDESMRLISRLITSSSISPRLKERAIDMKETLRTMIEKAEK